MTKRQNKKEIMGEIPSIAIDSNAFRDLGFINYLEKNRDRIHVHLPSVVYLEVGYYFMSKGISWESYEKQLQRFDCKYLSWDLVDQRTVLEHAIANKEALPVKIHFRDFIIGVQCMNAKVHLITYNKRHFQWCTGITIFNPVEFTSVILQDKDQEMA